MARIQVGTPIVQPLSFSFRIQPLQEPVNLWKSQAVSPILLASVDLVFKYTSNTFYFSLLYLASYVISSKQFYIFSQ